MWSEPEPWIVAVLLATGVAVIARHPIAHAIGTEVDGSTMTPSVVASAAPANSQAASAPLAIAAPVPTHAPRNPFGALVDASGAIVAPDVAAAAAASVSAGTTVVHHHKAVAAPTSTPAAAGSATCAGSVHTVVPGDTLWSLAAKIVKSNDTGKINVVWHRIYQANTPPLGSNPSLLPVGAQLCLPSN
ncbi:MAG TPA: LysM domain-containing protein [Mycobacteriales bacterium]|jgi:nucleoid-associated protein YgaU|nr:LysM domain-containing protein [Mycobacteriales bacterium]